MNMHPLSHFERISHYDSLEITNKNTQNYVNQVYQTVNRFNINFNVYQYFGHRVD